jgi:SnoaL-like domain
MSNAREVAVRWAEAYDAHDEQQIHDVLAPDAVLVSPEGVFEGRAAIVDYMMAWARAFGGGYTIEHVTSEGDRAVLEMTWEGVHDGVYTTPDGDIPATNRAVRARSSHTVVVDQGLAQEVRMYFDVFGFLSQLGLLPAGAPGG